MTLSAIRTQMQFDSGTRPNDFAISAISPDKEPLMMKSVYRLVAGNLAFLGEVNAEKAMTAAQDPIFDHSDQTQIIAICHHTGRIAGTVSITLDSLDGMPITRFFAEELNFLRKKYKLANCWRFSLSPLFEGQKLRTLALRSFKQALFAQEADAFVLYFNERLSKYYSRFFKGRILASKEITFDGVNMLPVQLMICMTNENRLNAVNYSKGARRAETVVI